MTRKLILDSGAFILDAGTIARFWAKVEKAGPNDCWLWTGGKSDGYGTLWITGLNKMMAANRVSLMIHLGRDLKTEEYALHNCPGGDNKACVNPEHLYLGSHAQNMHDKAKKGQASRLKGQRNPYSKLSDDDVIRIRQMYKSGEYLQSQLAELYGLKDVGNISQIVLGTRWAHLNEIEPPVTPFGGVRGRKRIRRESK